MAWPDNPHLLGVAVEVMVGSVSSIRSTPLTTSGFYGWSRTGSPTLHTMRDGITITFPYSPHTQPAINCEVLRVTEIVLNSDETIAKDGVGADYTERWAIQPLDHRVLIKPKEAGIATDLIVETNRRSYHFALRTRAPYMPQVAF